MSQQQNDSQVGSPAGTDETRLQDDIPTELNDSHKAMLRRARQGRRAADAAIGGVPVDWDAIKSDARRAHNDGDAEAGRRRVVEHHRHLATDAFGGRDKKLAGIASSLGRDIEQLRRDEAAERGALKGIHQFDRVPGTGKPWPVLSILTVISLAGITLFLFYSSMQVVQGFLEQLGRVNNTAQGFVLAPLTVLGPVVLYIVSLGFPTREARNRYMIGVAVTALVCLVVWVTTFPLADPGTAGGQGGSWGAGSAAKSGIAFTSYSSTVAQLCFDVLAAAACKLAIHQICDAYAGDGLRTKPKWRYHNKRIGKIARVLRIVDDTLSRVTAKQAQMESRTAAACKRAVDAFDDRLKKLRTDMLDVADIMPPTTFRSFQTVHGSDRDSNPTHLNGSL